MTEPDNKPILNGSPTDLHHFYHVYAAGKWHVPLREHIAALRHSGLINSLKTFQIGIVGTPENRKEVIDYLNSEKLSYLICAETIIGWEQETLDKLHEFARFNDGYVLYAHTKGAAHGRYPNAHWRKSMTYHTVILWKDAVKYLDEEYCAVGTHLLKGPISRNTSYRFPFAVYYFFGGNFWWTKLKYIREFPLPARNDRYAAEVWIGWLGSTVLKMGEKYPKIHDYIPSHPNWIREQDWITEW